MLELNETRLIEKLRAVEALYADPGTAGERAAAGNARERILERLQQVAEADPPITYRFSMPDLWSRRIFVALLRRYGITPYRLSGQRYTTVMAKVSTRFVDETLWPQYEAFDATLRGYLNDVTDRVVAQVIHGDLSEAAVSEEPAQLPLNVAPAEAMPPRADAKSERPSTRSPKQRNHRNKKKRKKRGRR